MWIRCFVVVCGLMVLPCLAHAGPAERPAGVSVVATDATSAVVSDLTLERAQEWSRLGNPEIEFLGASTAAAVGDSVAADILENPELSLSPGIVVSKGDGGNETGFHGEIEIAQKIEFPGKRALRKAIADGTVRQREVALEAFYGQLEIRVRRAFYEVLAAREILQLREQQREIATRFAEAARKRADTGYGSDFEATKGDAEVLEAERGVRAARGELAAARVGLFALFGKEPTPALREVGSLDAVRAVNLPANVVGFALERNPELRLSRMEADAAGLGVDAAKLASNPDLTVAPSAEISEDEQIYGIGLSIPLPLWNSNRGGIETATAEERRARAEIGRLERDLSGAVRAATERLVAAQEQVALYTPEFLERLRSLLERAERGYGQSATTFLIYLDARKTYFDTLAAYYESLAAVATAQADLEEAIGAPLDSAPKSEGAHP